jgi:pyruvate dehydrogenase E2 component (dihydrolipoamide acetyltransferase)
MTEVIMPKMGDAMEEGVLVEWLKAEGDRVAADEPIANIQTDKAVVELPSPAPGVLAGLLVKPDDTVPVGRAIAAVLGEGEELPAGWGDGAIARKEEAEPAAPARAAVKEPGAAAPAVAEGRVRASPLAKKVAASLGVDLASVEGTGPGGRIVERDVRARADKSPAPAATGEVREVSRLRQIIAERTQAAKRDAPHFYVTVEVDMEEALTLRAQMNEAEPERKISVNDFVVKACVRALQDMPDANSNFVDGEWLISKAINVGLAVATDRGLLVPVIKNCETKSLRRISQEAKLLATSTRDGTVGLDDLQGSTFSVSNMGMFNVENFIAILNAPNVALVAISSIRRLAVVMDDGSIQPRSRMNITGSFDHRAVDGAAGARFMNVVRDYLQRPVTLLE